MPVAFGPEYSTGRRTRGAKAKAVITVDEGVTVTPEAVGVTVITTIKTGDRTTGTAIETVRTTTATKATTTATTGAGTTILTRKKWPTWQPSCSRAKNCLRSSPVTGRND